MKTAEILAQFMKQAYIKGLDTSGDATRFYRLTTARAWTRFHAEATKGKS
jgi:hypothetical protein